MINISVKMDLNTMNTTGNVDQNGSDQTTEMGILDENSIYATHLPAYYYSSKYMRILMYILGYPGNSLALMVWVRKPMLQSSGVYLAALAMSDLLFLLLDLPYSLQTEWNVLVLNVPIICEGFTIVYMASQYMSPILTLAFTIERYIAIKFPLRRRWYCTVKRALCTATFIAFTSLGLGGIQGYFWVYDPALGECWRRDGIDKLWEMWTWCTEMIMFLCVPLMILALNLLVIFEIRKSRRIAMNLNRILFKTNASTTMLLAVSFFLILTTLPVSIIYGLYDSFPPDPTTNDMTSHQWQTHFRYFRARTVVYNIGFTHFFMNFYIYLLAGERFRREVLRVLGCKPSRRFGQHTKRSETTKMESFYSSDTL